MKEVSAETVGAIMEGARWDLAGVKIEKVEAKPVDNKEAVSESKESKPETHVCPLCESVLKAALTDEQLLEHAAEMSEVFESVEKAAREALNEEEDLDADEDDEDELDEDEVDEDEDEDSDEDENE